MAKIVGLDIFGSHLLVAELENRKSGAVKTLQAEMPYDLTVANAEKLGKWLREQLSARGISAKDAVCTLGRDRVTLKSIDVPVCPDAELPSIVAFEMEEVWNQPGVEPVVDFQPGPVGELGREVFVGMAGAPLLDAIGAVLGSAGLECHHVSLRPHATHSAWQTFADVVEENILFVVPGQHSFDISIWQKEQLASCRSLKFGANEDPTARVVQEIRRTIVSHHSHFPDAEVERVVVCAPNHYALAEALRNALGIPVDRFDLSQHLSMDGEELNAGIVAAAGAALRHSAKQSWPIDLLNPKKPEVVRDRTKSVGVLVAVMLAMLPIGGIVYAKNQIKQRDEKIVFYAEQLNSFNEELSQLKPTLDRHKNLSAWAASQANWLHELQDFAYHFPDTTEAFVTELNLDAGSENGKIKVVGRSKEDQTVSAHNTRMAQHAGERFSVSPRSITPMDDAGEYKWKFDVDISVKPLRGKQSETLAPTWREKIAALKPADGLRRVAASTAPASQRSSSTASSSRSRGSSRSQRPTDRTVAMSADDRPAEDDDPKAADSQNADAKADSDSGDEGEEEPLVERLKKMSREEREKAFEDIPKFLHARLRQELKESR